MILLVKFPTRGRYSKFIEVLKKYKRFLSGKYTVRFLISCDIDDMSMNNANVIKTVKSMGCDIEFSANRSKIEAVNADMEQYKKKWDIVLLASDDMVPVSMGYDKFIVSNMKSNFPNTDGILFFNDGYRRKSLNTLVIMGRKYYDRYGYIYHPDYFSLWCDNEFTARGNELNRQKYIDKVIIRHEHPVNVRDGWDDLYRENNRFNMIDRTTHGVRSRNKWI